MASKTPRKANGKAYSAVVEVKGMPLTRGVSFGSSIGAEKMGGDTQAMSLMNDTRCRLTADVFGPGTTPDAGPPGNLPCV